MPQKLDIRVPCYELIYSCVKLLLEMRKYFFSCYGSEC